MRRAIYSTGTGRTRKLLLNRREINKLADIYSKRIYSIPVRVYLKRGLVKIELAVARGKKTYDKRESIARRDAERAMARAFRERQKI